MKNLHSASARPLCGHSRLFGLVALGTLALCAQSSAQTLLHDTFPANQRTVQNLPNSSAWFSTKSSGYVDDTSNGSLTMRTDTNTDGDMSYLLTYFTNSGTVDLQAGASLAVNFSFSVDRISDSNPANHLFRIGLYNSGGNRISEDGLRHANSTYNQYRGYTMAMGLGYSSTSPSPLQLYARNKNDNALSNTGNAHTSIGTGGSWASGSGFVSNDTYNGSFTILRNADDSLSISFSITGAGIGDNFGDSWTIAAGGFTSFDTFSIMINNSMTLKSMTLHEVNIAYNIPEPSSIAAVAGIAALALCALKRRRRA